MLTWLMCTFSLFAKNVSLKIDEGKLQFSSRATYANFCTCLEWQILWHTNGTVKVQYAHTDVSYSETFKFHLFLAQTHNWKRDISEYKRNQSKFPHKSNYSFESNLRLSNLDQNKSDSNTYSLTYAQATCAKLRVFVRPSRKRYFFQLLL